MCYGIIDGAHDFFSSYLTSRKQKVLIDGYLSQSRTVTCGVPQGSVLGPILFALYVNDFPRVLQSSKALMYADDTVILFTGSSLETLQYTVSNELLAISMWFRDNQLLLNTDKTKYIIFRSRMKTVNCTSISVSLNNQAIECVATIKYLGIIFDSNLNWRDQLNTVCKKLSFSCYTLIRARQ